MIAEDDAASRTILKKSVERFGHECLAAEDGLVACEQQRVCFCGWRLRRRSVTATGLCSRLP